jgi:hypothetical protein
VALLLRYDANHDRVITMAEMEAGLKADFAAADTNGDGCLDPSEVRAENQARLTRAGAEASPLVDWNLDRCVDAREFGNTVRSYFELADKTKDGKVSMIELRPRGWGHEPEPRFARGWTQLGRQRRPRPIPARACPIRAVGLHILNLGISGRAETG